MYVKGIFLPPNKYKKAKLKIGDRKLLYDPYGKKYDEVEIVHISDKGNYNVYHCKKVKNGFRTSFTDKDLIFENTIKEIPEKGERNEHN